MGYKIDAKVRQALDIIDTLLTGGFIPQGDRPPLSLDSEQSAELAAILSAMRGPDFDNTDLKWTTTSIIRKVAFPRGAEKFGSVNAAKVIDYDGQGGESEHFDSHIRLAAEALRIPILNNSDRDEVNDHEDDA